MSHHLVGLAEIAEMLGVSKQRVSQLVSSYEDFPQPEVELASGRIWSRTAVETWISTHQERKPGRPESEGKRRSRSGRRGPGMFTRFTDRARLSIAKAQEEARRLNHNYIGTEHLLLGLLAVNDGVASSVLTELGVDLDSCEEHLLEMLGEGPEVPKGHIPFTPRSKKVLEVALREALALGHNYIGTEHILLGLVRESDGVACQILAKFDVQPKTVRRVVLATLSGVPVTVRPEFNKKLDEIVARLEKLEKKRDSSD